MKQSHQVRGFNWDEISEADKPPMMRNAQCL